MASSVGKPTILLVHGAFHGSWCWDKQIPELVALGFEVETVDLPCTSGKPGVTQFDDAALVKSALDKLLVADKRVLVVAHSYGGPIGSAAIIGLSGRERREASLPGEVVGLIILCGYILPGGMDQGAAIRSLGGLPYVNWDSPSEGLFVTKNPRSLFYPPDVTEEDIKWALPQLRPQSSAANTGIVPPQAWQEEPLKYNGRLGYIKCTGDVVVPLADQTAMLDGAGGEARWHVRTLEASSHSPMLSRPKDVASAIEQILEEFDKAH